MRLFIFIFSILLFSACTDEELFKDNTRVNLWLKHNGAEMPVVIDGNTNSKIFLILVHGGPGGSAQTFNSFLTPFSDRLEEDYAVVYWDQRNSGMARGEWDPSKITLDQHIEDLDQVIELLKFKFGNDITLFLSGHSWGGYLSLAYLLDPIRQAKINAWINIDGLNHRNKNNRLALLKIIEIANQQIAAENLVENWMLVKEDAEIELAKNILNYNSETENPVFSIIRQAERIINQNNNLVFRNVGSGFSSTFNDNIHPLIFSINNRTLNLLVPEMYAFDTTIDQNLGVIDIPSLFIYGIYDVRTPLEQANYVMENISTAMEDKHLILLENSGHSSPANQPVEMADAMKVWIEQYK